MDNPVWSELYSLAVARRTLQIARGNAERHRLHMLGHQWDGVLTSLIKTVQKCEANVAALIAEHGGQIEHPDSGEVLIVLPGDRRANPRPRFVIHKNCDVPPRRYAAPVTL